MTLAHHTNLKAMDEEIVWEAFEAYPPHWLQNIWIFGSTICLGAMAIHFWLIPTIGLHPPRWLSFIAIVLYAGSTILDMITTQRCMRLHSLFQERGYETPFREANPMMPDYLSLYQNIFSWPSLFSLLSICYIFFLPVMGIGMTLLHLFASWSNVGVRKRAQHQLQLLHMAQIS